MEFNDVDEMKKLLDYYFAEITRLRSALAAIAEQRTCVEMYPPNTKYNSYERGWEGVALFAQKKLDERIESMAEQKVWREKFNL